jgi:hypothetical protein
MTETTSRRDSMEPDGPGYRMQMKGPSMTRGGFVIPPVFLNQGPAKRSRRLERRKDTLNLN